MANFKYNFTLILRKKDKFINDENALLYHRYMSIWSHGVDSQMLSIPLNIDGHTQSDNSNFDDHQPAEPNLGPCSLTEGDGAGTLGESMDSLTSQQSDTLTITEEQGDLLLDAFAATIDNFEDYIYQVKIVNKHSIITADMLHNCCGNESF